MLYGTARLYYAVVKLYFQDEYQPLPENRELFKDIDKSAAECIQDYDSDPTNLDDQPESTIKKGKVIHTICSHNQKAIRQFYFTFG